MPLKDNWYIAAEARELKRKPIGIELYGEKLVLFRDAKGEPAALEDRCAHRNLELSEGRTVEGCIECQYHGWRYDGAGALTAVPSLGANACVPNHRVRAFPAAEQDGYIWVFLGRGAPQSQPFHFPHYGEKGWTTFRMKTRFEASVESCLENFLDCPHTVFVHKGWFRSHDTRELTAIVQVGSDSVEARFHGEPISKSVVSRLFFPKGRELKHTDRFEMPNLSRVDYDFGPDRHFIITSQCTPIAEYETEVYTVITFRFGSIGALVRLVFEPLSRHIIQQDVDVLRAQTRQIRRFDGPRFAHVETDLLGLKIHALRRCAERNDPRVDEKEAPREITICF
ncbi:MAG: aromatic ring-hydroxylating dioxygenase subunit alpha [Candidatus Acidiferrales bacterium]